MLLVSLGVGLLVVEVILRVIVPPRTTHCVWPANMTHTYNPPAEVYPDLSRETHFSTNSRGLRGPDLGRDEDELRVLAIGGSTTELLYHDDAKTWTAQVGSRLGEHLGGKRVWVGNAGRSGMNSRDNILHARHLLAELPRIDALLVLIGVNDLIAALAMPDRYKPLPDETDHKAYEQAERRAFFQVPGRLEDTWDYDRSFIARSQIYQLIKRVRRQGNRRLSSVYNIQDQAGTSLLRWRENRSKASRIIEDLPDLKGALGTYRDNLATIARIAKERGVPLTLMTQPTLWRADLGPEEQKLLWMGGIGDFQAEPGHEYYSVTALAEGMRRFNEVTLEVCQKEGLSCVDLAKEIPKDSTIFYDDCHFGRTGASRIAELVAAQLAKQAPFGGPGRAPEVAREPAPGIVQ